MVAIKIISLNLKWWEDVWRQINQKRVGNIGLGPGESLIKDCVSLKGYVELEEHNQ